MKNPVHCKLLHLINSRQLLESKKTCGDNTKIKLLHNLYTQGKLFLDKGLVMVKSPSGSFNGATISIPPSIFPGLANAIHIRLDHPSKSQLSSLISRHFYTPGWRTVIENISNACPQCASVKRLPKVLIQDSTSQPNAVGSDFAADIIEREYQKILVIRECASQFTRATLIPDQKSDTIRNALIPMVLDIMPDKGTSIRVDGSTAFQHLEREATVNNSILKKLGIRFVVGRLLNKNKNPVAENTIKEVHKEILRYKNSPGPITSTDLAIVLKNINARIRYNSKSPKEILFRRSILSNEPIDVKDNDIANSRDHQRKTASKSSQKYKAKFKKQTPAQSFHVGDLVMLRDSHSKTSPRETFIVDEIPIDDDGKFILIRKLKNQIRPRLYKALPDELIHSPTSMQLQSRKQNKRKAAIAAQSKIKSMMLIKSKPQKQTLKFKHGWKECDQEDIQDMQIPHFLLDTDQENINPIPHPLILGSPNSPVRSTISSTTEEDWEDDLAWDESPDQISLQSAVYTPTQEAEIDTVTLPPPFTRNRLPAVSRPPLTRQPAFRIHQKERRLLQQPQTPTNTSLPQRTPIPPRKKSCIPRPASPSNVLTNQVNDISLLPNPEDLSLPVVPVRRSTRLSRRQALNDPFHTTNSPSFKTEEEEGKTRENGSRKR